ncbi:MAG: trypsin-like serine peptidase [Pyrinomonadaceae bacterium]
MTDDLELRLKRAERTLQQHSVDTILNRVRAIIGPANMPSTEQGQLAQQALDQMRAMKKPTPQQLNALEYVIRLMRPAPLSRSGTLDIMDAELSDAFPDWNTFRQSVKPYLYSIGRIDSLSTLKSLGTGFLVTKGLLATNRHVLEQLSYGTNMLEKGQGVVRFGQEYGTADMQGRADIISVVAVHDSLDIALLGIEQPDNLPERNPLTVEISPVKDGDAVVAIGYPFDDPARNPLFINALFGGKFGVKRAAPGEVLKSGAPSIFHDCSTLGGNSGSPILSMKTARLVGLHRGGFYMYRNEAIDAGSLEQFVRQHA